MPADIHKKELHNIHFQAWKKGLKTGMYYLRSRSAVDAVKVTVSSEQIAKENFLNSNEENNHEDKLALCR